MEAFALNVCNLQYEIFFCLTFFVMTYSVCLTSSNWEMCAHMFATFEETADPAKFKMKYWGAASYLQTGSKL